MERETIEMQKLAYFTEGNTFTGVKTKDAAGGLLLRWLARPDRENGRLLCWAWKEDVCFELAENRLEREEPLDEEGLSNIREWLLSEYEALGKE